VRMSVLKVTVTDSTATENAIQEVKQESHKSMLVGLSGVFTFVAVAILIGFYIYTRIEGNPMDKEELDSLWSIIKEALSLAKDIFGSLE